MQFRVRTKRPRNRRAWDRVTGSVPISLLWNILLWRIEQWDPDDPTSGSQVNSSIYCRESTCLDFYTFSGHLIRFCACVNWLRVSTTTRVAAGDNHGQWIVHVRARTALCLCGCDEVIHFEGLPWHPDCRMRQLARARKRTKTAVGITLYSYWFISNSDFVIEISSILYFCLSLLF